MMLVARTFRIGFLSTVLAVVSSFAQAALAEPGVGEDPQRLVADTINQLVDRLKENSDQIHKDSNIAYRISDELVAPHIDFPRVTRLVIGKYWQTASEQQRQALIAEVQSLLIRSYVTAMTSYADQIVAKGWFQKIDFEFDGEDPEIIRNGGKCRVAGRMVGHGGHDAGVDKAVLLAMMIPNPDL